MDCKGLLDEALVVAGGTPAVDARVGSDSGLDALVPQQLLDGFKATGLGVEQDFCAQVPELVWCENDASPSFEVGRDQPRNCHLAFRAAIGVDE